MPTLAKPAINSLSILNASDLKKESNYSQSLCSEDAEGESISPSPSHTTHSTLLQTKPKRLMDTPPDGPLSHSPYDELAPVVVDGLTPLDQFALIATSNFGEAAHLPGELRRRMSDQSFSCLQQVTTPTFSYSQLSSSQGEKVELCTSYDIEREETEEDLSHRSLTAEAEQLAELEYQQQQFERVQLEIVAPDSPEFPMTYQEDTYKNQANLKERGACAGNVVIGPAPERTAWRSKSLSSRQISEENSTQILCGEGQKGSYWDIDHPESDGQGDELRRSNDLPLSMKKENDGHLGKRKRLAEDMQAQSVLSPLESLEMNGQVMKCKRQNSAEIPNEPNETSVSVALGSLLTKDASLPVCCCDSGRSPNFLEGAYRAKEAQTLTVPATKISCNTKREDVCKGVAVFKTFDDNPTSHLEAIRHSVSIHDPKHDAEHREKENPTFSPMSWVDEGVNARQAKKRMTFSVKPVMVEQEINAATQLVSRGAWCPVKACKEKGVEAKPKRTDQSVSTGNDCPERSEKGTDASIQFIDEGTHQVLAMRIDAGSGPGADECTAEHLKGMERNTRLSRTIFPMQAVQASAAQDRLSILNIWGGDRESRECAASTVNVLSFTPDMVAPISISQLGQEDVARLESSPETGIEKRAGPLRIESTAADTMRFKGASHFEHLANKGSCGDKRGESLNLVTSKRDLVLTLTDVSLEDLDAINCATRELESQPRRSVRRCLHRSQEQAMPTYANVMSLNVQESVNIEDVANGLNPSPFLSLSKRGKETARMLAQQAIISSSEASKEGERTGSQTKESDKPAKGLNSRNIKPTKPPIQLTPAKRTPQGAEWTSAGIRNPKSSRKDASCPTKSRTHHGPSSGKSSPVSAKNSECTKNEIKDKSKRGKARQSPR